MDCVFQRLSERARFAVVRLRSLGDCVLTTPALALLKQTRPDLEIAVVVEDRFARFSRTIRTSAARSLHPLSRWRGGVRTSA
jgi:hypothetical protein